MCPPPRQASSGLFSLGGPRKLPRKAGLTWEEPHCTCPGAIRLSDSYTTAHRCTVHPTRQGITKARSSAGGPTVRVGRAPLSQDPHTFTGFWNPQTTQFRRSGKGLRTAFLTPLSQEMPLVQEPHFENHCPGRDSYLFTGHLTLAGDSTSLSLFFTCKVGGIKQLPQHLISAPAQPPCPPAITPATEESPSCLHVSLVYREAHHRPGAAGSAGLRGEAPTLLRMDWHCGAGRRAAESTSCVSW